MVTGEEEEAFQAERVKIGLGEWEIEERMLCSEDQKQLYARERGELEWVYERGTDLALLEAVPCERTKEERAVNVE